MEFCTSAALERCAREARTQPEREHVTLWMRTRGRGTEAHQRLRAVRPFDLRLTVDYPDDLVALRRVLNSRVGAPPNSTSTTSCACSRHTRNCRDLRHVRNEGLAGSLAAAVTRGDSTMKRCVNCRIAGDARDHLVRRRRCLQHLPPARVQDGPASTGPPNKRALDALIEEYRGKYDYDCIVPFSGGKDSTWTLYYLVKEYGIKPLVVRFDHGFMRPNLEDNNKRTLRKLGVDFLTFTPNWKVVQKLMLQTFLEKGDFCWHCHTGIFSYPMWIALEKKVPLIFWGEPSAEYTAYYSYDQEEEVDEKRFNRFVNLGITADDMYVRLGGTIDAARPQALFISAVEGAARSSTIARCASARTSRGTSRRQSEIIQRELGWKGDQVENVPPQYQYEKIECYMQGVRDYIKFIKRGYSRPSHLVAIDVRNDRMQAQEGRDIWSTNTRATGRRVSTCSWNSSD